MGVESFIIALLTTLLGGGGLGAFFTIKYVKKKAKGEAEQAERTADALTLKNTNEIVDLYKTAMHDLTELNEKREKELQDQISKQNQKIKEQSDQLDKCNKTLKQQSEVIAKLTQTQGILKLEIENLKKLSLDNCNSCEFKENCMKYTAKRNLEKTIKATTTNLTSEIKDD